MEVLINFKSCFAVHIITTIKIMCYLVVFYVPAKIIEFVTTYNLLPAVDYMLNMIDAADDTLFEFAGFNLTKPSYRMTNKCYSCNGKIIKSSDFIADLNVFTDLGIKFGYDFTTNIPPKMQPLVNHWTEAFNHLNNILNTSIF